MNTADQPISSFKLAAFFCIAIVFSSCDIFGVHERNYEPNYPCENGLAQNTYPCQKVDLMSHLSARQLGGSQLNDIWGWTDPSTLKSYALVGLKNGVSFVDISRPNEPGVLGRLGTTSHSDPDHSNHRKAPFTKTRLQHGSSTWRDMKVYRNHMYVVSEESGYGVQVFDLTRLRNKKTDSTRIFQADAVYDKLSSAHNIHINTETGYAYAVGTDGATCGEGGLHMINIKNPESPKYAGCFAQTGYIHDTQCVIYHGPDRDYQNRELCFNSNADSLTIVDVTNKEDPRFISGLEYEGAAYVHQGWLTENHRYFLVGDELDELRNGHNLRTYIIDIKDLDNIELHSIYEAETPSIDHNLYVKGNYAYQSNYTSGLSILSLEQIDEGNLEEIAYFDTYPLNDRREFSGSWSNYPFFDRNIIVLSDITGGLFVLRANR